MIKKVEIEDIEALVSLHTKLMKHHEQYFPHDKIESGVYDYAQKLFSNAMSLENTHCYVYRINDKIVGYIFSTISELSYPTSLKKVCHIRDIFVDTEHQNKKIGEGLYLQILNIANENKCQQITINASTENEQSVGFWKKMGLIPKSYSMVKRLDC